MRLFKWNISDVKPKFPNIVERFFGKKITDDARHNEEIATVPSVNIADEAQAFEVEVALPGINKKDVNIEVYNNNLIISSEKKYEKKEKDRNWMRREYGYASFQRIFELPENADQDMVQAKMKNGILSIKVAKKKGADVKKQIAVN
jgi:HSP20 family protein